MSHGTGDRKNQQRRRRKNNKNVPHLDKEVFLIDGNYSNQPYAYCNFDGHFGYLTKNQTVAHDCENKECLYYRSLEWALEKGIGIE